MLGDFCDRCNDLVGQLGWRISTRNVTSFNIEISVVSIIIIVNHTDIYENFFIRRFFYFLIARNYRIVTLRNFHLQNDNYMKNFNS